MWTQRPPRSIHMNPYEASFPCTVHIPAIPAYFFLSSTGSTSDSFDGSFKFDVQIILSLWLNLGFNTSFFLFLGEDFLSQKVNYYVKHLVQDGDEGFNQALEWIVEGQDPKIICHDVVVLFADMLWSGLAGHFFLLGRRVVGCKTVNGHFAGSGFNFGPSFAHGRWFF